MSDSSSKPARPRKRSVLRWFVFGGVALIGLLVGLYFFAASQFFLKTFLLPQLGKRLQAQVSVSTLQLSPFKHLRLTGLQITPRGTETLCRAGTVDVRYHLIDILRGKIHVDQCLLKDTTVHIVQKPDGSGNLQRFLQALAKLSAKKPETKSASAAPVLDLHQVRLENASLVFVQDQTNGSSQALTLTNLNFTLDRLQNGQPSGLTLSSDLAIAEPDGGGHPSSAAAHLESRLKASFAPDWMPASIQGNLQTRVTAAQGGFADLTGSSVTWDFDLAPTQVRHCRFGFSKDGQPAGSLELAGPLDLNRKTAQLSVGLELTQARLLNGLLAPYGWALKDGRFNAHSQVGLAANGTRLDLKGRLTADSVKLNRDGQSCPTLKIAADYAGHVDLSAKTARLDTLKLSGLENDQPILDAGLARPMAISWGGALPSFQQSTFQVRLHDLRLEDWRALLGDTVRQGAVSLQVNAVARNGGRSLELNFASDLTHLGIRWRTNTWDQLGLHLGLQGTIQDWTQVNLQQLEIKLGAGKQPDFLSFTGSGRFDPGRSNISAQTRLDLDLAPLLASIPSTRASLARGKLELTSDLQQQGSTTNLTAQLRLDHFNVKSGGYDVKDLAAGLSAQVTATPEVVQVPKFDLQLAVSNQPPSAVDLTGEYHASTRKGTGSLSVSNVNEALVGPLWQGLLGKPAPSSVTFGAGASVHYLAQGDSSFHTELHLSRLAWKQTNGLWPNPPFKTDLSLDGGWNASWLKVRTGRLSLPGTSRAENDVNFQAEFFSPSSPAHTNRISLESDAFDLAPVQALFASSSASAATNAPAAGPPPAKPPPQEPPALNLPLQPLAARLDLHHLYWRDLDITNAHVQLALATNRLELDPIRFVLNGAPVQAKADVDLGVPGYRYQLQWDGDQIPVEPLANSFSPSYRGRAEGDLLTHLHLEGAGLTGPNLRKNLKGTASLVFTNANIHLVGPTIRILLTPVAVLLRIPEILGSPLNALSANLEVKPGTLQVQKLQLLTQAFHADTQGPVPLALDLTQSPLDLPVHFALRRSLAKRGGLIPAGTPTNLAFVPLPDFIRVHGTLGRPRTKTDKLVLAGLGLKSVVSIPGFVGQEAGQVLGGIGNLLTGKQASSSKTSTNAPPSKTTTNQPPAVNPFQIFNNLLHRPAKPAPSKKSDAGSSSSPP